MKYVAAALAVLLVVGGVFGLVNGGIIYVKERGHSSIGPLDLDVTRHATLAIARPVGGLMLVAGLVLLYAAWRWPRS
jgi:protein-S-isoprenylcysteine O-methyltransferase Ste14